MPPRAAKIDWASSCSTLTLHALYSIALTFLTLIERNDKNKQQMKIFNILSQSLVLFLVLISIGCATPYYGYSKEDWEQLTKEEKQAAKAEYQEIIDYQYRRNHEDQFEARKQQVIQRGLESN